MCKKFPHNSPTRALRSLALAPCWKLLAMPVIILFMFALYISRYPSVRNTHFPWICIFFLLFLFKISPKKSTQSVHQIVQFQSQKCKSSLVCPLCLQFELSESIQLIKHLFHTFLLLFRFKSKYGCPISFKITKLYFILNIIQLPRGLTCLKIIKNSVPLLNFPFKTYLALSVVSRSILF